MGVFVNGHWHEELADPNPNGGSNLSSPDQSPSHPNYNGGGQSSGGGSGDGSGGQQSAPVATAPPPSGMPQSLGNTNDQSVRQNLRNQGYYIDATGVYAPGSGQRVSDTFSGSMANQNQAPSPTRLPILNGHPVSPSNGFTGQQTPYVMYRGDPLYSTYFGPDTPGYSSTSETYNATPGPLPDNQATYGGTYPNFTHTAPLPASSSTPSAPAATGASGSSGASSTSDSGTYMGAFLPADGSTSGASSASDQMPASVPAPGSNNALGSLTAADGQTLANQSQETQAAFHSMYGNSAEQAFVQQHNSAIGSDASSGSMPVAAAPAPQPSPAATPQPAPTAQSQSTQPATVGPNGEQMHTFIGSDGKPFTAFLTEQDYQGALQDQRNAQEAARQALQFQQGLDQGKLDLDRSIAEWNKAYQQGLLDYNNRQLAQTAANEAMVNDLTRQAQQLTQQQNAQQFTVAMQQAADQRSQQAQTNSIEREKLDVQRQQIRPRRLPAVRYA